MSVVDWVLNWKTLSALFALAFPVYVGRKRAMEPPESGNGLPPLGRFSGMMTRTTRWIWEIGASPVLLRATKLKMAGEAARHQKEKEALQMEVDELRLQLSTSIASNGSSSADLAVIPTNSGMRSTTP